MLPELPPLGPHDHPDPHAMVWSELELRAIRAYATAYATACVLAEREACARECETVEDGHREFRNWQAVQGADECAAAIRARIGPAPLST